MKFFFLLLTISSFSRAATDMQVNCTVPEGFAGQAASVKGTLKKSAKPTQGYFKASGTLSIKVGGSNASLLYNKRVVVKGVILEDGALNLMSDRNPELTAIYINRTVKDLSSIEINGKSYISNCLK